MGAFLHGITYRLTPTRLAERKLFMRTLPIIDLQMLNWSYYNE